MNTNPPSGEKADQPGATDISEAARQAAIDNAVMEIFPRMPISTAEHTQRKRAKDACLRAITTATASRDQRIDALCHAGQLQAIEIQVGDQRIAELSARVKELEADKTIVVTKRSRDYHACIDGDAGKWGCGSTQYNAVGSLIHGWMPYFGITLKLCDAARQPAPSTEGGKE